MWSVKNRVTGKVSMCGLVFLPVTIVAILAIAFIFSTPISEASAVTQSTTDNPNNFYYASISTDESVKIPVSPASYQKTFTNTTNVALMSSCKKGSTIYISTNTDNNTLARPGSDNAIREIPSIYKNATSLYDNTWGVSIDDGKTFAGVPGRSEASVLYSSDKADSWLVIPVTYGIRVNSQVPSGNYTNEIIYTVTVNPQCLSYTVNFDANGGSDVENAPAKELAFGSTIDLSKYTSIRFGYRLAGWSDGTNTYDKDLTTADVNPTNDVEVNLTAVWDEVASLHEISTMQEMTPETCYITTTPLASATDFDWNGSKHHDEEYIPRTVLTDTRDSKKYLVSKLADGNCWMSQNLALSLKESSVYSSNDTNITTKTSWKATNNTLASFTDPISVWSATETVDRSYIASADEAYYNGGNYRNSTPTNSGDEYLWESAGAYYNWNAATAGSNAANDIKNEMAQNSICPKGWTLPSGDAGDKSFENLLNAYNLSGEEGATALRKDPLNFIFAGYYNQSNNNTQLTDRGQVGRYYTSGINNEGVKMFGFGYTIIATNDRQPKNIGASIRCIAE